MIDRDPGTNQEPQLTRNASARSDESAARAWVDPCRRRIAHSLARALNARHSPIVSHSERVAARAEDLARRLGWDEAEAIRLFEAAHMHDIGMVAVPDAVLLKPAPVTDEERPLHEVHPALGAWITTDLLDDEQRSWIRGHHERWDGGGYPDGLQGEAIPPGARVLAVAEAWDELTWPPPDGLDAGEALARWRAAAGSRFAPEVVAALEALEDDARRDRRSR